MRVLGISGSLRADSHNTRLLTSASRVLPVDAELEQLPTWVLRDLPHYDDDLNSSDFDNAALHALRAAVDAADAILWVTPEYNGGMPSAIKNALDWLSRPRETAPIKGKPSAVLSASTSAYGGVWAQDQLRKALKIAGARAIDAEFSIGTAHEAIEQHGDVLAPADEPALAEILEALTEEARINQRLAAAA